MTIIQPNKTKNFLIKLIIAFSFPILGGVLWVIVLYNQSVSLEHNIHKMNIKFQELQTQNAELQDRFFAFFTSQSLDKLASEKGLIKDKQPQYLEVEQKWIFASQQ